MRTTRPQQSRSLVGRAAALLAGAALLGACTSQPGIAAGAGDVVVTEDEVTTATEELNEAAVRSAQREDAPASSVEKAGLSAVARSLLMQKIMAPHINEAGLTVTDAEFDEVYGDVTPEGGWSAPSRLLLSNSLLNQKAAAMDPAELERLNQDLSEALAAAEVDFAPRYATTGDGAPLLPTWLAQNWRGQQAAASPAG